MQKVIDELIEGQKKKLLEHARRIVPYVTPEDIMQPNDFPELETHPSFRYEEGILDGMQVMKAALLAQEKDVQSLSLADISV